MKNFNYSLVDITGGFWKQKQDLNINTTINAVYDRFYDSGRIDAFKMDWKEGMDKKPHIFWDSDVAKWIEGVAYILKKHDAPELKAKTDAIIDNIEKNQCDDGYFNIFYTVCEPENRFTDRNCHELYCAGHLIEAAVAYYEATGEDKFLNCMIKYADYIEKIFVIDKSAKFSVNGHEEIELALIKLYRCTGNEKYLKMSLHFLNARGQSGDNPIIPQLLNEYDQNHMPVKNQREALGHAVRACYLYTAMADMASEINDKELAQACKSLFDDIVNHKMYITGGIGSTHIGEAFTVPYDLPNETAYAETCASISMIFFAMRMQKLENKAIYADIIERELYNGMLSGLSLDGKCFFYENPLEINLVNHIKNTSTVDKERMPITQRPEIFWCSCCPPNLNRLLASVGDYIYSYDEDTVYVNQFVSSTASKDDIKISVSTNYPTDGAVKIECSNIKKLAVRIPSWCSDYTISQAYKIKEGYAIIESPAEAIECNFKMEAVLIESNTRVSANYGKAALCYGPLVYCIESVDNGDNLYELYFDKNVEAKAEFDEYFNANILYVKGYKKRSSGKLHAPLSESFEECTIKMIPYFGFANRGESNMLVYLQYR